jgi:uncharacterized membrane protein YkvA (DUF1232 family)
MNKAAVWKQRLGELKTETYALYLAARDSRVPWYAKLLALAVAAYVLSPIDFIPDFIPVLGYVDDLIIVPLGIALTVKMIPPAVLEECRHKARETLLQNTRISRIGAAAIIFLWVCCGILAVRMAVKFLRPAKSAVPSN